MFPSEPLLVLFFSHLEVQHPGKQGLGAGFLSRVSYEYFYAGKKHRPSLQEYEALLGCWLELADLYVTSIELKHRRRKEAHAVQVIQVESNRLASKTVSLLVKIQQAYLRDLKQAYKEELGLEKSERVRVKIRSRVRDPFPPAQRTCPFSSDCENIAGCGIGDTFRDITGSVPENITGNTGPCTPLATARLPKKSLLVYAVKKRAEVQNIKTHVVEPRALRRSRKSLRVPAYALNPVRMVFFKHHNQIRPPYYNVKSPLPPSFRTRVSTRRILAPEEYEYDSGTEWIEGDGENISENEAESDEEEQADEDWIEQDANDALFSKGQLPHMDFPCCVEYILQDML